MCCSSWPSAVSPYLDPQDPPCLQSQARGPSFGPLEVRGSPTEVNMPPPTARGRSDNQSLESLTRILKVLERPNVPRVLNCRVTLTP